MYSLLGKDFRGAFYMVFTHFSIAQVFRLYFAFGFILSQIHFIGVGRFRILGGPRFRILGGGGARGAKFPAGT